MELDPISPNPHPSLPPPPLAVNSWQILGWERTGTWGEPLINTTWCSLYGGRFLKGGPEVRDRSDRRVGQDAEEGSSREERGGMSLLRSGGGACRLYTQGQTCVFQRRRINSSVLWPPQASNAGRLLGFTSPAGDEPHWFLCWDTTTWRSMT